MSLDELVERWQDYDVSYAGYSSTFPTALMFDLKNDDKKLVTDTWKPIEDLETLLKVKKDTWESWRYYWPKLYKILDPQDRLYGYMYTPWTHVVIKVVDESTLWVEDLPHPPVDRRGGFTVR
jgi:hypothetical protein